MKTTLRIELVVTPAALVVCPAADKADLAAGDRLPIARAQMTALRVYNADAQFEKVQSAMARLTHPSTRPHEFDS